MGIPSNYNELFFPWRVSDANVERAAAKKEPSASNTYPFMFYERNFRLPFLVSGIKERASGEERCHYLGGEIPLQLCLADVYLGTYPGGGTCEISPTQKSKKTDPCAS
jgi:hypothetical protein